MVAAWTPAASSAVAARSRAPRSTVLVAADGPWWSPTDGEARSAPAAAQVGSSPRPVAMQSPLRAPGPPWRPVPHPPHHRNRRLRRPAPRHGNPAAQPNHAPPGPPERSVRVNGPPFLRAEERPMATKAIVGEKVGMTQVWDDAEPRRPRDRPQGRARAASCRSRRPRPTATAPCRSPSATKNASQAHQARGRPLREGRRRARARGSSSCASTT